MTYVRESLLATGGQGEVYLGKDVDSGEKVVIKQLRPDLISKDPEFVARFLREAEALAQLDHPNIVKMLATYEQDGRHQIVMEYVPGGSLRQLLDSEVQLPLERVLSIGLELADALSRAHHLGVIHRDIKPANVLLAVDGTPRLTDFGLARIQKGDSGLTQDGSILGSPAYMSPEALRGDPPEPRNDIWSFGAMLFEMVAGRSPFGGDQISVTMTRILTEPPPDLAAIRPDCPQPLVFLIEQMLTKEKEQRLPSMRQVAAELEAIQSGRITGLVGPVTLVDEIEPQQTLPLPSTPFIGREKERIELELLLTVSPPNRLVTIVGPGGIGKSRLALEAASAAAGQFPDGVYFIPLAPLTSADHIVAAISENIGYRYYGGGEPRQQLLDYLSRKDMLLVLDNFEHLMDGAILVADIMGIASKLRILATSRERLHLSGEAVYHLAGMSYPRGESELKEVGQFGAVQLLAHHALLVRPELNLNGEYMRDMGRICQ
jgi:non-specific serine/threonine protein kinase